MLGQVNQPIDNYIAEHTARGGLRAFAAVPVLAPCNSNLDAYVSGRMGYGMKVLAVLLGVGLSRFCITTARKVQQAKPWNVDNDIVP